jgi:hypothetical protein
VGSQVRIYGLLDLEGRVRYVGKTREPLGRRVTGHLQDARRGRRSRACDWLRALAAGGARPGVVLLEVVDEEHWRDAEVAWIQYGRWCGWPLLNQSDGGPGTTGEAARANGERLLAWLRGHAEVPSALECGTYTA